MPRKSTQRIYQESWNNLPTVNYHQDLVIARGVHPILKSITTQVSQDLLKSIHYVGDSDSNIERSRIFSIDGWDSHLFSLLFNSLLYGQAYLLLDYGDLNLSEPSVEIPKPLGVITSTPTVNEFRNLLDVEPIGDTVDDSRYIKLESPYSFPFYPAIQSELSQHDQLRDGIVALVKGQGVVKVGIDNLFEILQSNIPTDKLYQRLRQIKQANTGDGVLAYDLEREAIDIIPKTMNKEVESVRVIENRISAMTGLPSFIIWGHTDGDGYGVESSLRLYNQRITSLSGLFLQPIINYLLGILNLDLYAGVQDIFVETEAQKVDRFAKIVDSLSALQSIGAITSIEVRDTVMSLDILPLVLNPNPTVVSPTVQPEPNNPGLNNGFSI